jgi:hypothetical protein
MVELLKYIDLIYILIYSITHKQYTGASIKISYHSIEKLLGVVGMFKVEMSNCQTPKTQRQGY